MTGLSYLSAIKHGLEEQGIAASDRRWKACAGLVRAKAWLEGESQTSSDNCEVLVHALWSEPSQIRVVERVVSKISNPLNLEAVELEDAAKDLYDQRPKPEHPQITEALEPILRQLSDIYQRLEQRIAAVPDKRSFRARQAHRFLLRVRSDNLDSYHFHNLVARGIANELRQLTGQDGGIQPVLSSQHLRQIHRAYGQFMGFSEEFLTSYKGLIFQIRSEGISVSDRRVVKLTKLFAASALFDGRAQACDADFFVLKHTWNSLEQSEILDEIVSPVVDRYYREHPAERRFVGTTAGLDELLAELKMIRDLLTSGQQLSDIQLFSQLRNLNDIKTALQAVDSDTARRMVTQVDQLLESIFASSKFI